MGMSFQDTYVSCKIADNNQGPILVKTKTTISNLKLGLGECLVFQRTVMVETLLIIKEESFIVVKWLKGEVFADSWALDWNGLKDEIFLFFVKSSICKFV